MNKTYILELDITTINKTGLVVYLELLTEKKFIACSLNKNKNNNYTAVNTEKIKNYTKEYQEWVNDIKDRKPKTRSMMYNIT